MSVDATGYSAGLLTLDEIQNNLGFEIINNGSTIYGMKRDSTPDWVYNSYYWIIGQLEDSSSGVWIMQNNGYF